MKVVVIGGSGLIGARLVAILRQAAHEIIAASPSSGVDALTGEGLADAVADADVVVDVTNPGSFAAHAPLEFFEATGRNLLAAERAAGVRHHVALSVVGADRLPASGYFGAKAAQEKLVRASQIPHTIVRSTQFFEFVGRIARSATEGQVVRLPPSLVRPIAAQDVAAALAITALGEPADGIVELAGPESMRLDDLVQRFLTASGDERSVVADIHATYFGARLSDRSLMPVGDPLVGPTRFEDWLGRSSSRESAA